ncbi:MAG: hypothetical protein ACR2GR_03175 [Rhodothermales bacterium]
MLLLTSVGSTADVRAQAQDAKSNEVYSPSLFSGLDFRMIGPSRGGRVTTVTGHRGHPSTFW